MELNARKDLEMDYTSTRYRYDPLEDASRSTRMATLQPGAFKDTIRLSITHISVPHTSENPSKSLLSEGQLDETLPAGWKAHKTSQGRYLFAQTGPSGMKTSWSHPSSTISSQQYQDSIETSEKSGLDFEALSYVWGSQDDPELVYITQIDAPKSEYAERYSDKGLLVGRNLAVALRYLRLEDEPRRIWVDAICINQSDLAERQLQVQLMRDLYQQASRVIVWLGPKTAMSSTAMSTIRNIGKEAVIVEGGHKLPSPDSQRPEWNDANYRLPFHEGEWEAVYNMLGESWFSRLWVMQEVALAGPRAAVAYGFEMMPWCIFRTAITGLYSKEHLPWHGLRDRALNCLRLVEEYEDKSLMQIMEQSRLQACADPKDKIYGVLGISPAKFAAQIQVDYSTRTSVAQAYKSAFLAHLLQLHRWELFSSSLDERRIDGPTWVPDWIAPVVTGVWGSRQQYSSGRSRLHFEYLEPGRLDVVGLRCAVVKTVKDSILNKDPKEDLATVRSWEPRGLYEKQYLTGDSLLDAYAITLLQNRLVKKWVGYPTMPSLTAWKAQEHDGPALFGPRARNGDAETQTFDRSVGILNRAYNCVSQRTFAETEEGYIGLVPIGTRPGDLIIVVLGCDQPLVLRSQGTKSFLLVGHSFVYGLNDAQALLGQMPQGWYAALFRLPKNRHREGYQFYDPESNSFTREDPRMSTHPDWERISVEDAERMYNTPDEPMLCDYFRNKTTGEIVSYDPRLEPDTLQDPLQARGLSLE